MKNYMWALVLVVVVVVIVLYSKAKQSSTTTTPQPNNQGNGGVVDLSNNVPDYMAPTQVQNLPVVVLTPTLTNNPVTTTNVFNQNSPVLGG